MRVAVFTAGPLAGRGQGRALARHAAALGALGHAVRIVAPDDTPPADRAWLEALRGPAVSFASARDVLLELLPGHERRVTAADAAVVMYGAHHPLLETVRLLASRPVIFDYAGLPPRGRGASDVERDAWARAMAGRCLAAHAHLALVPRPELAEELFWASALPLERIAVGAPAAGLVPRTSSPEAGPLLVTVGRPAEHKRLTVLVEHLARLARVHPDARLVVAGSVEDREARAARDDAVGWARALGVAQRLAFTGWLPDAQLAALFARATSVVFASGATGRGQALADARAAGCRVVVLDGAVATAAPVDWTALLDRAAGLVGEQPPPPKAALMDEVAAWRIGYADTLVWLRAKIMRRLTVRYARELERVGREMARLTALELRSLDLELEALEARLRSAPGAR